jgi:hypothetical protein
MAYWDRPPWRSCLHESGSAGALLGPAPQANGRDDGGRGLLRYGFVHSSSHVA